MYAAYGAPLGNVVTDKGFNYAAAGYVGYAVSGTEIGYCSPGLSADLYFRGVAVVVQVNPGDAYPHVAGVAAPAVIPAEVVLVGVSAAL